MTAPNTFRAAAPRASSSPMAVGALWWPTPNGTPPLTPLGEGMAPASSDSTAMARPDVVSWRCATACSKVGASDPGRNTKMGKWWACAYCTHAARSTGAARFMSGPGPPMKKSPSWSWASGRPSELVGRVLTRTASPSALSVPGVDCASTLAELAGAGFSNPIGSVACSRFPDT